ncbi:chemotaxis protein CheW [Paucibacter sp. PLA-PC-4]|uniref:chemotaxis protein CheW n=1 Tax=Paucibacter sp. PLA-PC-4 TaxID=2993655 RepID=UPI00224B3989|nr:chemotaxis protein CheW [Paucibacter sp. PLA-PC-4]MCX2863615.1 chemotaxis protein CheW [Paucibacter sp. PLA-PC-4]
MIAQAGVLSYARVRISGTVLAIDISDIERAIPLPPGGLGQVPRRKGALAGVIQSNSEAIPVASIGEWVKLDASPSSSSVERRVLILRGKAGRLGILVDALLGVASVGRERIQQIFRNEDPEELFDRVLPSPDASLQSLPLLEADRLLHLANMWCESRRVAPGHLSQRQKHAAHEKRGRYAVLSVGSPGSETLYAVPATAVSEAIAAPIPESTLKLGGRTCGVTTYRGRKLAMVDFAAITDTGTNLDADWIAVVNNKGSHLGLCIQAAKQLLDLAPGEIEPSIDHPLLSGVAVVEQLGQVRVIDMDRLFESSPESVIGGELDASPAAAPMPEGRRPGASATPYLLFQAGRRYASPVDGIVQIVALDARAEKELNAGSSTMIRWRDRTVRVAGFPSIGAEPATHSKLAVLVETDGAVAGVAIDKLEAWVPAHSVEQSSIRLGLMGDVSMVTIPGNAEPVSTVVVNLQEMGYLIS